MGCRATNSLMNQQQSFLCCCITSVEQVADRAKTVAVDRYLLSPTQNILVWICLHAAGSRLIILFFSIGLNASDSVTITVTFTEGEVMPSVLWRCCLGGRKGIQPVKNMEWWGAGVVVSLGWGANDLLMVQLMPLPPHHLLQQNLEWFILLVLAYPSCPGKKAVKRLCVCVCVCVTEGEDQKSKSSWCDLKCSRSSLPLQLLLLSLWTCRDTWWCSTHGVWPFIMISFRCIVRRCGAAWWFHYFSCFCGVGVTWWYR